MERIKNNNLLLIYVFMFSLGIITNNFSFSNGIIINVLTLLKMMGFTGLIMSSGYYFSSKNKKMIGRYLSIFYILLIVISLISYKSFMEDPIFKIMSFVSFLSPIVKTTSSMNFGAFIIPSIIIICMFIYMLLEGVIDFKNKKNLIVITVFIGILSLLYGLLCYKKLYFISDDRFLNIYNIFSSLFIFFIGILINKCNKNKKDIFLLIILLILSIPIVFKIDFSEIRFRVFFINYYVILLVSVLNRLFLNKDNKCDNAFILMIIIPVITNVVFNLDFQFRYLIIIYLLLLTLLLPLININKINIKSSIIYDYIFKTIILVSFILCLSSIKIMDLKRNVNLIYNNKLDKTTKYLNPIVNNFYNYIDDNSYSYMYVDLYEEEGFLNNSRFRYMTVPNQMLDFNRVSYAFNYYSDSELKELLCKTKVDYIVVKKSKRVENITGEKIPKNGKIYKKNNSYCSDDLNDYFIVIEEVK